MLLLDEVGLEAGDEGEQVFLLRLGHLELVERGDAGVTAASALLNVQTYAVAGGNGFAACDSLQALVSGAAGL